MRLWSLHPAYLDRQGLTAAWREALLAQAVLRGETKGYQHHSQLVRFKATRDPVCYISAFLCSVWAAADARDWNFNSDLIAQHPKSKLRQLTVTTGQLDYEWQHLLRKLQVRSPDRWEAIRLAKPRPHPLFRIVPGQIESWEVTR